MYISSSDSLAYHPLNEPSSFSIELPGPYNNVKRIALLEFGCKNFIESVYVLCDLVERNLVHDDSRAVLRYISDVGEIQNPLFVDTIRESFNRISFTVLTQNMNEPTDLGAVHMILALDVESD